MNKNSDSSFPITVLWVRSTAGVNFQVMFIERGTLVHPRLRGTNLVTMYLLSEVSCVIPNKSAYVDDEA